MRFKEGDLQHDLRCQDTRPQERVDMLARNREVMLARNREVKLTNLTTRLRANMTTRFRANMTIRFRSTRFQQQKAMTSGGHVSPKSGGPLDTPPKNAAGATGQGMVVGYIWP